MGATFEFPDIYYIASPVRVAQIKLLDFYSQMVCVAVVLNIELQVSFVFLIIALNHSGIFAEISRIAPPRTFSTTTGCWCLEPVVLIFKSLNILK